jgi:hypothetical protein
MHREMIACIMNAKIFSAGLLAVAVSAFAGTSSAQVVEVDPAPSVVVSAAPPVEIVETPGVAPSADHFWIRGHWGYARGRYVWAPGRWEHRRPGYAWNYGHWARGPHGYSWHRGGWYRGRR